MRARVRSLAAALVLLALAGCSPADGPVAPEETVTLDAFPAAALAHTLEDGWEGGAIVRNAGAGKPDAFCFFGGGQFFTTQALVSRQPTGHWTLSCLFTDLPELSAQETLTGWICSIIGDPSAQTHHSSWVRSPAGSALMNCHFSDKPTYDAVVTLGTTTAAAQQAAFTLPLTEVPGQELSGAAVGAGLACAPLSDLTGRIAVIERGVCSFVVKLANAQNAGAAAAIVYNSAAFGEQIIVMGGTGSVGIPGVFVARSTGLALLAASAVPVGITHCTRSASCRGEVSP